jgi:hypothetical protein
VVLGGKGGLGGGMGQPMNKPAMKRNKPASPGGSPGGSLKPQMLGMPKKGADSMAIKKGPKGPKM